MSVASPAEAEELIGLYWRAGQYFVTSPVSSSLGVRLLWDGNLKTGVQVRGANTPYWLEFGFAAGEVAVRRVSVHHDEGVGSSLFVDLVRGGEVVATLGKWDGQGSGRSDDYLFGVVVADGVRLRANDGGSSWVYELAVYGDPPPAPDTDPPAEPVGLTSEPLHGAVRLTWQANTEPDLAGYRVYVDGQLVADIQLPEYTLDAPEYRAYEVAVTAYDLSGNESQPARMTVYPLDPTAPLSPPGPPRDLVARPGPRAVILQWSPPADGADSYRVYRDGEYLGETTTTKWEDRGVSPNRTYSYAVVAVNAAGDSPPATVMVHTPDAGPLDGVESHLGGLPGAVLSGLGLLSPIAWVAAALILAHILLTRGLQMIAGRRRA